MITAFTLVLFIASISSASSGSLCTRCNDEFTSFHMRRGRGASPYFSVSLPAAGDGAQHCDPAAGWRSDVDGVAQIANKMWLTYQGPPNIWIDTATGVLKMATVSGAPTASTGYRSATDFSGPQWWRDKSAYAAGKLLTTTGVLQGTMGGSYFIWESAGIVADFEELSIDMAPYTGGLGGAAGLVFSYNMLKSGKTYYAVMLRNCSTETGIGLYKVDANTGLATPLQQKSAISFWDNSVVAASAITLMNANGARVFTRLTVVRTGARIQAFVGMNTTGTPVLDYTDPNPLPAGNVGIHSIGMTAIVYDNMALYESPSCTDGVLNGDEEGTDCGGSCPSACIYPYDYNWDFSVEGHVGWAHETYGTDPNGKYYGQAFVYTPTADGVTMPTNANGALPGSVGTNTRTWSGSWWLYNTAQPPVLDVDVTVEIFPKDNDYIGMMWRYIDRDNFYILNMRTETASGTPKMTVQRRRGGDNTIIWASTVGDAGATGNPTCPDASGTYSRTPYHQCTRQFWRVVMIGSRIEVYIPDWTSMATVGSTAMTPVLVAVVIDPNPLISAGRTGVIATTHDGTIVYSVKNRHFAPLSAISSTAANLPITPTARDKLVWAVDARPMDITMPEIFIPDYSRYGRGLYSNQYIFVPTQIPNIVRYRGCGNAINFPLGAFMYTAQDEAAEPGIGGMALLFAFSLLSSPTAGTAYTLVSKGMRLPTLPGYRIQIADRGSGLMLYFELRSSGSRVPTDPTIVIATPIAVNIPSIVMVNVAQDPTQGAIPARFESIRYIATGWLNNVSFIDNSNNVLTGVIGGGNSRHLYVGSLEDGTSGMNALLLEAQAYGAPLSARDMSSLYESLATKWSINSISTATCISLLTLPNVTFTDANACGNGINGAVCRMSCDAGTRAVAGDTVLTCNAGVWDNTPLTCLPTCTVPTDTTRTNHDQVVCRQDLWAETFTKTTSATGRAGCEVGACTIETPFQSWLAVPAGSANWLVNTPGRLTRASIPGVATSLVRLRSAYYNYEPSLSAPGTRIVVTGSMTPMSDGTMTSVSFSPRYFDDSNYYAVVISYTTGATNSIANSTTFVRILNGVRTVLCTANAVLVTNQLRIGSLNSFSVLFESTSRLRVAWEGYVWCDLAAENTVSIGSPAYSVTGSAVVDFGPLSVALEADTCADGTIRNTMVAGSTLTLGCNVGYTASGDTSRTCSADGTMSGSPLVCALAPPTMSNAAASLPELSPAGTLVSTEMMATGVARGLSVIYSITSGNNNNSFTIGGCDGSVRVAIPSGLDFENKIGSSFFILGITASVIGSNVSVTAYLSITCTDINDPPYVTNTLCSINENAAIGTTVCGLSIVDPDTAMPNAILSITYQDVAGLFDISGNLLRVAIAALNFEAKSSYSLTIRSTDATDTTSYTDNQMTVQLVDVNEAPVVTGPASIQIISTDMITGQVVQGVIITYTDEDQGDSIQSMTLTATGTYSSLVAVSNITLGSVASDVNTAGTYTLAGIYTQGSTVVCDYAEMTLAITDVRGATGSSLVRVFVLPNISSTSPLVRSMIVLPSNVATGAGSLNNVHTITTDGSDAVRFMIDNLVAAPGTAIVANASSAVAGNGVEWNVTCDFEGVGTSGYVGSNPVSVSVRCPTQPGVGLSWSWNLKLVTVSTGVAVAGTPDSLPTLVSLSTDYAAPLITSVAAVGLDPSIPTIGGSAMTVTGYNFGGALTTVTIEYGPVDPVSGIVQYVYALNIVPSDISHTSIRGFSVPGCGNALRVRITVGSRSTEALPAVLITYTTPTVTNVTQGSDMLSPISLSDAGGDLLTFTGSNFGPVGSLFQPILYFGPIPSGTSLPTFPSPSMFPLSTPASGTTACTVVIAHTQIQCFSIAAVGKNLAGVLVVSGAVSNALPSRLSYTPPSITGITGSGSRDMDTKGGQAFYLSGNGFGPAGIQCTGCLFTSPVVTYGPVSDPTRYIADSCTPVLSGIGGSTAMLCQTVEGAGAGPFVYTVTVANQTSASWTAPLTTKYSNPKIASFVAVASYPTAISGAKTTGYEALVLTGKSFGPYNESSPLPLLAGERGYEVYYYGSVDLDGSGNMTSLKYRAINCWRPVFDANLKTQHERMQCITAPGAGAALRWEVTVDGQRSDEPTTSYAAPVVRTVSRTSTGLPQRESAASDLGNTVVYLQGDFFGPDSYAGTSLSLHSSNVFLQWVKFGPGGGLGPAAYTPVAASLEPGGHSIIKVTLPPGIGKNLQFQVSVADQVSSPSPISSVGADGSIDYVSPVISAVTPSTEIATSGGQAVRVNVNGIGLLDPTTEHRLTLGGIPQAIVERFPSAQRIQAAVAAGNYSLLTAAELDPAQHYLAFLAPARVGLLLPIVITASRRSTPSSNVANNPAMEQDTTWVSYAMPSLSLVAVEPATSPSVIAAAQAIFGYGVNLDGVRQVTLFGTNFGPASTTAGAPEVQVADENTPNTYTVRVAVLSWQDTSVVALTTVPRGNIRMGVRYRRPDDSVSYPDRLAFSNTIAFTDVAPSVSGLNSNAQTSNFNTAGGDSVIIRARNIAAFSTLQVFIGGTQALFVDSDGVTIIPDAQVKLRVIDPQTVTQAGQGIVPDQMIYDVRVRVPAGQGTGVSIAVIRDAINGTGPVYIDYAPPTITSVSIIGFPTVPVSSITPATPFRISTKGAVLSLTGADFGICPVIRYGLARWALCSGDAQPGDQPTFLGNPAHTQLVLTVPAGVGRALGINALDIRAGNQVSAGLNLAYALPTLDSIRPSFGTLLPTAGNVRINVTGTEFGPLSAPELPELRIYLNATTFVVCGDAVRDSINPQEQFTCTLPAGSGKDLTVEIVVADQSTVIPAAFSYDAPVINAIASSANSTGSSSSNAPTTGGYPVQIFGNNFGDNNTGCIFLPYSTVPATSLLCNGVADSWNEQEVPSSAISFWNDTFISFIMPAGMGARTVRIVARNQMSRSATANSDVFRYNAPRVASISPVSVNTNGGDDITLTGSDFGFGPTQAFNDARTKANWAPVSLASVALMDATGPAYAQPFALRINFFDATHCISSAVVDDGAVASRVDTFPACRNEKTGYGVVTHTHDKLVFKGLPGVGRNHNLSLSIIAPDGSEVVSAPFSFAFGAPVVKSVTPDSLDLVEPKTITSSAFVEVAKTIIVKGVNLGPVDRSMLVTDEEKELIVNVGGSICNNPSLFATIDPDTKTPTTSLQCDFGATTIGPISSMTTVGYKAVSVRVAAQNSAPGEGFSGSILAYCEKGFYGFPGEVCATCPSNAQCDGYRGELIDETTGNVASNVLAYGKYNVIIRSFETGGNWTECIGCHTQPRALVGYFNMKGKTDEKGATDSVCEPVRQAENKRAAKDCDFIVACDPPEACLADNICASGYTSTKWPYRCSQCEDGFYRSAGNCRACPNNPALNILFFFVVAVFAIGFGWILNQKGINIAFLTIGLDYMQVISIFASTRVAWPQQLKDLFRILSAFNLNIEIIAPECAFKGITYGQKWGMIMALPVAVFALLILMHTFVVTYYVFIKGQSKSKIGAMASPLIAMAQVLMYFLFLYITRSVFDVMTCRGMDPPEYDSDGKEITYMIGIFERCGIAGGTQLSLIGGAVAALVVYVLGYPSFIGYNLWKNRDLVMEDQLLRAKRVGNDNLTNPNAFEFRRRYSRTYYQFRPDMFLWVLVILLRKFLIAVSSLVFNTNQNFQMAAMLLVLFLAYAAQVRYAPYMGPSTFDDVLKAHTEAARQGDIMHAKLAMTLAKVQARGRKRTYANTFSGARTINVSMLAGAVGRWLFDYNSVESLLLASAFLVSLAGVMFGAVGTTSTSSFYIQSRDGVTNAVILLIALSITYWLVVVGVEMFVLMTEENAARALVKKSQRAEGKLGKGEKDINGNNNSRNSLRSESDSLAIVSAVVESTTNPMLRMGSNGKATSASLGAATGIDVDAIREMSRLPADPQIWIAVREAYIAQAERAAALSAEVSGLKAKVGRRELEIEASLPSSSSFSDLQNEARGGDGPSSPISRKKSFGPVSADDNNNNSSINSLSKFRSPLQRGGSSSSTGNGGGGSSSSSTGNGGSSSSKNGMALASMRRTTTSSKQ